MIVAGTGHRPPKAGLTYGHDGPTDHAYVSALVERMRDLRGVLDGVVVGGALGWDTLLARAAYMSRVRYHLFIPFEGQELAWPAPAQERYRKMRELAYTVKVVSDGGYESWKMQARNEAMVNHASEIWALWDGTPGGTANCLRYAAGLTFPPPVVNFYGMH